MYHRCVLFYPTPEIIKEEWRREKKTAVIAQIVSFLFFAGARSTGFFFKSKGSKKT